MHVHIKIKNVCSSKDIIKRAKGNIYRNPAINKERQATQLKNGEEPWNRHLKKWNIQYPGNIR